MILRICLFLIYTISDLVCSYQLKKLPCMYRECAVHKYKCGCEVQAKQTISTKEDMQLQRST